MGIPPFLLCVCSLCFFLQEEAIFEYPILNRLCLSFLFIQWINSGDLFCNLSQLSCHEKWTSQRKECEKLPLNVSKTTLMRDGRKKFIYSRYDSSLPIRNYSNGDTRLDDGEKTDKVLTYGVIGLRLVPWPIEVCTFCDVAINHNCSLSVEPLPINPQDPIKNSIDKVYFLQEKERIFRGRRVTEERLELSVYRFTWEK